MKYAVLFVDDEANVLNAYKRNLRKYFDVYTALSGKDALALLEEHKEMAVIVTDMNFKAVDTYQAIIKQPEAFLENMDEWNTEHHGDSGLTAKVPSGKEPEEVEKELCELTDKHFPHKNDRPILCGNSIFQDRRFIDVYFKDFAKMLHYRMLDVTAWKIIMNEVYHVEYQKRDAHRALDDIRESIEELKRYKEKFFVL